MIKDITLKYGYIIDNLTAQIKKNLSENNSYFDDKDLLFYTEDEFLTQNVFQI